MHVLAALLVSLPLLASASSMTGSLHGTFTPVNATVSLLSFTGAPSLPLTASSPLHPALSSFSIELAFFTEYLGNASSPNTLSQNLFQNLVARTGVPAEVRIGGITADSTYWDGAQEQALVNGIDASGALQNTTIGPAFWKAVELLPQGAQVIITLDLENLNYTGALSVAQAAWDGLNPGQVLAFEIGNEPDQYADDPLTPQNYTAIWEPWSQNISLALSLPHPSFQIGATAIDPLWPYNTTAANAQLDCVSALKAGADDDGTVKSCSEHVYQYSVCDPIRTAVATLPNLVNHTRLAMYLDLWQPRIASVREQLGDDGFVIGEFNSVSCSGKEGVSNTFGDALWLLDTTFYAASNNVSRVYVHQGGPLALQSSDQLNHGGLSFYNLWFPVDNQNGPIQVFPSYSAYLFVAETLGPTAVQRTTRIANVYPGRIANGSTVTTAEGDDSRGQLAVYAFWEGATENPTKVAVLNLEIWNSTETGTRPSVSVDLSAFFAGGDGQDKLVRTRRLWAPGADVTAANETLWAGQEYSSGVANGSLVEEWTTGGKVEVQASEAVLVWL